MNKSDALKLFGGTVTETALACGITPSAVSQWPEELTKDQVVRVQAALWRIYGDKKKAELAEAKVA